MSDEIRAWTPSFTAKAISAAVTNLPESQKERLQEEWSSHVAEIPGEVSKLVSAIGFIIASFRINRQLASSYTWRIACTRNFWFERTLIYIFVIVEENIKQRKELTQDDFIKSIRVLAKLKLSYLAKIRAKLILGKILGIPCRSFGDIVQDMAQSTMAQTRIQ